MSQEELKFSNTIVASGHDLLLIGGTSGRQKRERKVPSRYQDTDAFFDSATGMPATSAQKAAAALMSAEENSSNHMAKQTPSGGNIVSNSGQINATTRRLTQEGLKYEKIKKCTGMLWGFFFKRQFTFHFL